jgi:hypothetical protein
MTSFLFDVTLTTSIRVTAPTSEYAENLIREFFAENEANLGMLDGEPVIAQLTIEGDLDLVEVDGESAP